MDQSPIKVQQVAGSALVLDESKRRALLLLTEGGRTYAQVAAELHIDRATLFRWRREPKFAEQLAELQAALAAEVAQFAIGRKHERMSAKDERWKALHRIVTERSEAMAGGDIPGGGTGFMVRDVRVVGGGPTAYHIDLYQVDTGLLKEFNAIEKEASIEAGQRVDKQEIDAVLHAGPPAIVRITNQAAQPYTPNREGMDEPGQWVEDEDGVWRDADGAPFSPETPETPETLAPPALEEAVESLVERKLKGELSQEEFEASLAGLQR